MYSASDTTIILFSGDGEEEEDVELEPDSSDEDGEDMSMNEEPGNDSGCTAVVALLRGKFHTHQALIQSISSSIIFNDYFLFVNR